MRYGMNNVRRIIIAGVAGLGLAVASPARAEAPDGWITTKVKLQLMTTDGVSGTAVNVDTNEGAVVLHGKVKSELEKQKAETLAKAVDGVKSVKNLLQVVPASEEKAVKQSDDAVKTAAEKSLKTDKSLDDIKVISVNDGVVLLRGETDTIDQHLRAVRLVAKTAGVRRVASEITTEDDATLARVTNEGKTRDIRDEAKGDARDAGKKVTAATNDATAKAKSAGNDVAASTRRAGHRTVDMSSDAKITTSAKLRLIGDQKVPALDVNVDTDDGVVTLFGAVPTAESKAAAEADVKKISGVVKVNNQLQIVPASEKKIIAAKDDDIEKNVAGAFKNTKDFEKIDIDAKNGVVRLTGEVPTIADKVKAATIARSQSGVKAVEEDLKVDAKHGG